MILYSCNMNINIIIIVIFTNLHKFSEMCLINTASPLLNLFTSKCYLNFKITHTDLCVIIVKLYHIFSKCKKFYHIISKQDTFYHIQSTCYSFDNFYKTLQVLSYSQKNELYTIKPELRIFSLFSFL